MADNFPSRIPLLWLLTPFIFGIIAGRIFPVEIHPVIYTVVIALSIASIASANQPLSRWAPMLLPATAFAGYVYIVQMDMGIPALMNTQRGKPPWLWRSPASTNPRI